MLVLTRKLQERIHIGNNVTVTIVRIQGNTVRVGIEAPGDVRVVRGEVAVRDLAEREAAQCDTPPAPPCESIVLVKREPPLARITANHLRLRLAPIDSRAEPPSPGRVAREATGSGPALTC